MWLQPNGATEGTLCAEMADFTFERYGTIVLCQANTAEAQEHLDAAVGPENILFARALVVEPRYVETVAAMLEEDGFTTEV